MTKAKKRICLVLCAALAFTGMMSGCGKGKNSAKTDGSIELEVMADLNTVDPNSPLVKEMEKELDVTLKFVAAPTGSADDVRKAINLQFASGDVPDLIANVKFPDYYTYAQQGLIAEIPVDLIKSEAPDITNWIEKNLYGESSWDYYKVDGKNYVVPSIWTIGEKFATVVIREDWLDEVGITKIPDTLEEMEQALVKIKEAKSIYPLTGGTGEYKCGVYDFIFGAYGLYPKSFIEKDGKIIYGLVQPEAKQALETANRWYEMGLIDPEFVMNTGTKVQEKWISEKAAVAISSFYHAIPEEAYWGGIFHDKLLEKNPNAKIAPMLPPAGPNGERGITQDNPIVNAGVCLSKEVEKNPEKLKKYLQLCNYQLREQKKTNVGIEGETYQYDTEGNIEWIPPYDQKEKRKEYGLEGASTVVGGFVDYDIDFSLKPKKYEQVRNDAVSKCVGEYDILGPAPRPIYQQKQEALNRIENQALVDFITGTRDLSEFDKFVEEWYAAGGTEVLEEAQEYYKKLGLNNRAKAE